MVQSTAKVEVVFFAGEARFAAAPPAGMEVGVGNPPVGSRVKLGGKAGGISTPLSFLVISAMATENSFLYILPSPPVTTSPHI